MSDLTSIFGALGIIGGWAAVHWLSQRRDRDKARRELIVKTCDAMSEQVARIMASAVKYHLATARDIAVEIELNSGLKDLSAQLRLLNGVVKPKIDGVQSSGLHKQFKQAITGRHFEDEHLGSLNALDPQINEAVAAASELRIYLSEIKFNQFI